MDIHKNARTTRHSRMLMVQRLADGWTVAAVAEAQGVSAKTVRKWRDRFARDPPSPRDRAKFVVEYRKM